MPGVLVVRGQTYATLYFLIASAGWGTAAVKGYQLTKDLPSSGYEPVMR